MNIKRENSKRKGAGGRNIHDVGGLEFSTINHSEHELTYYEKRVDALLMLLVGKQYFRVDALRRMIESYAEQEYDGVPYYDRWIRAIRNLLVEQEILGEEEISKRINEVCERFAAEGLEVDREPVP